MSFRLRLVITILLLIALSFGIGGTVLISVSFETNLQNETETCLRSFRTVQETLYLLNSMNMQSDYSSIVESTSRIASQDIPQQQALRLRDQNNIVFETTGRSTVFQAITPPEDGQCSYIRVNGAHGRGLQVCGILYAGDTKLTMDAFYDLSGAYRSRDTQLRLFLMIYAAVVVLGALAAWALAISLTRRLNRLKATVRKIAGGDLTTRSGIRSRDEFGQLSRDVNIMANRLQANFDKMETEMQRQETFMGAFAHELKTPMTSIIGYADLLRQDGLDNTTRMVAANYIFSEGQRLEKLSFKLLDLLLLKKDPHAMKEVSLPVLVQEIEQAMGPVLRKKGIRLVARSDRGKAMLEPDLVKSLLYNLIDNAAKAMEPGTSPVIALKAVPISGGCRFQVLDNGRGMEQAELSKITEAFYRVDKSRSRKQGGAGLGLALCAQIVELHHGDMQFLSAPGAGTRVTVTLYGEEASHG